MAVLAVLDELAYREVCDLVDAGRDALEGASGTQTDEQAIEKHMQDIQRQFAGRLTPAQHRAVADALALFWHDDD